MKQLKHGVNLDLFFRTLWKENAHRLLMLDYDGTLAPFKVQREEAKPYPGVCKILGDILRSGEVKIVIISGRPVHEVDGFLDLDEPLEIWGEHGFERRLTDGSYLIEGLLPLQKEGIERFIEWASERKLSSFLELKTSCVALHWRGVSEKDRKRMKQLVIEEWQETLQPFLLEIRPFDGGLELHPVDMEKGIAVRTLIEEAERPCVAAYLGDDYTDESAFRTLHELLPLPDSELVNGNNPGTRDLVDSCQEGCRLGVLVRKERRETAADILLDPPDELLAFLRRWIPENRRE